MLVAEDDDDILDLVTLDLDRAGYAVITARDGGEALAAVQEHESDLTVLDASPTPTPGAQRWESKRLGRRPC